jgi:hypothetical protein
VRQVPMDESAGEDDEEPVVEEDAPHGFRPLVPRRFGVNAERKMQRRSRCVQSA